MADKLITDLTEDTTLDGTEYLHIIQSGNSRAGLLSKVNNCGFMGAMVSLVSDQTSDFTLGAAVNWDKEEYDTHGFHDNVTNNDRLTIPSGLGITHAEFTTNIYLNNITANDSVGIRMYTSAGVSRIGPIFREAGTSLAIFSATSGILPVTAGFYVRCYVFSAVDTSISVNYQSSVFGVHVRAVE